MGSRNLGPAGWRDNEDDERHAMKKPSKQTTGVARRALPVAGTAEAPQSSGLPMNSQASDDWALPATRGIQARHEYYVVLVRLRELPHLLAPSDVKARPSFGRSGR
ncbi:hypothetical protein [Sorangium sp. So ce426]|uniref:hypothetical protein n=1 Tax=Sorangium sp. So ce426 TaxID=3133312 RepID=UPI003F5C285A